MFTIPQTQTAQLAYDTIVQKPTKGIPTWVLHIMEHTFLEKLAEAAPDEYKRNPEQVYKNCQLATGVCMIDQWIPTNPLTMADHGYENTDKGATTGAKIICRDGIVIDSPETVVEHLQRFIFPEIHQAIVNFNEQNRFDEIMKNECEIQETLGQTILKTGYGFITFPYFRYGTYGYENYFMAYALYPEIIEQDFALQADLALLNNKAAAQAYSQGNLPPMFRLDHDIADSRGTLVNIASLDKIWFPHFARCLKPLLKTNVKMIWHCDGNLMQMVPRLLEVGLAGFQGFQYEDGMDYEKICKMKTRDGNSLIIIGGASVTNTLPNAAPADVKKELDWLVEKGPATGLFLGCSSSVAPGVPWQNIQTLIEGLKHYRINGR